MATLLASWDETERIEQLFSECSSRCLKRPGKPVSIEKVKERALEKNGEERNDDHGLIPADELIKSYHALMKEAPAAVQDLYMELFHGPVASQFEKEHNEMVELKEKRCPSSHS